MDNNTAADALTGGEPDATDEIGTPITPIKEDAAVIPPDEDDTPELDADGNPVESDDGSTQPGFVEIEIDGEKQVVPEAVAEAYKTDGGDDLVDDEPFSVAPDPQAAQMAGELQRHMGDRQHVEMTLGQVNAELSQYKDINWAMLKQQDPDNYDNHRLRYEQLRETKADSEQWLGRSNQTVQQYQGQLTQANHKLTLGWAKKNIPGWTPSYDKAINTFARKELGFPEQTLLDSISPQIYKALHLAYVGHRTVTKINKPPKPKQAAAAGNTPSATKVVRGKSTTPSGPNAKQSTAAWMAARNKQVRGG
jgi:hypothetical protein